MKFYEIINPSDKVLVAGDDFEAIAVVVCILGMGRYGLTDIEDGSAAMPLFLFGGHDEWFKANFGHDFQTAQDLYCGDKHEALIAAFESCFIGNPEDFETRSAERNDERRSSMNDICGRAAAYAKALRDE